MTVIVMCAFPESTALLLQIRGWEKRQQRYFREYVWRGEGQSLPGMLRLLQGYSAVLESYFYSFLVGINSLRSVLAKS